MYNEGVMTLPTADYLRRFCSAIDTDIMSLTESGMAYLRARCSKLLEKDRLVSLLMDKVYVQKNGQYINGKFYGDGNITKTLLCVMLKSLAGKYRDIVCMTPIVTINVAILE